MRVFFSFMRDESGSILTEYGLLGLVISVIAIVIISEIGDSVMTHFHALEHGFSSAYGTFSS